MCEVRWTGAGLITSDEYTVIYSGGHKHERGVGILLDEQRSKCMIGYCTISDRIMLLKLKGKPFDISIIQLLINQKKNMSNFTMISKWPNLNINPKILSSLWELAMKDTRVLLDLMALATEMKEEKN